MPGDYDSDGKSDLAIYQASYGYWYIYTISGTILFGYCGGPDRTPVSGDFDGDRKADPTAYSETSGDWAILLSGASYAITNHQTLGGSGFTPVPADYDGDGRADIAVYREVDGFS